MDDYNKTIENLKETIERLMKKLKECEQTCEILQENRTLLKAEKERLAEKVKFQKHLRKVAEDHSEKAKENFVEFLMESYNSIYIN